MSLAIWYHAVLPATWHKWTQRILNLARQAGTWFIYPGAMEGWADLGDWFNTKMVFPHTDGHPSKYYPGSARPGVEHTTCWSQVRCPNYYTTKPHINSQLCDFRHSCKTEHCLFSTSVCKLPVHGLQFFFSHQSLFVSYCGLQCSSVVKVNGFICVCSVWLRFRCHQRSILVGQHLGWHDWPGNGRNSRPIFSVLHHVRYVISLLSVCLF